MTTPDLSRASWRKSSYSNGSGGTCVEVAQNLPGVAVMRDSKLGERSPVLAVSQKKFATLTQAIKDERIR